MLSGAIEVGTHQLGYNKGLLFCKCFLHWKYMGKYFVYINYGTPFGFCVLSALEVFYIGQKGGGGRPTKILPARQTHFGELFWAPFGENPFSKNAPTNKIGHLFGTSVIFYPPGPRGGGDYYPMQSRYGRHNRHCNAFYLLLVRKLRDPYNQVRPAIASNSPQELCRIVEWEIWRRRG